MFSTPTNCARCSKAVYHAEQALGPGRRLYHKLCLKCMECNRRLDSLNLLEHDNEAYCKNCHKRLFGTQDLRSANLPQKPLAPSTPPRLAPSATGPLPSTTSSPTTTPIRVNNTGSPGRKFTVAPSPKCPRCSQSVFFAEQVRAIGKVWHKGCMRCGECGTGLGGGKLFDHDKEDGEREIYCKGCYDRNWGAGRIIR